MSQGPCITPNVLLVYFLVSPLVSYLRNLGFDYRSVLKMRPRKARSAAPTRPRCSDQRKVADAPPRRGSGRPAAGVAFASPGIGSCVSRRVLVCWRGQASFQPHGLSGAGATAQRRLRPAVPAAVP